MSVRLARLISPCAALVVAVAVGSCTEVNSAIDHVASLEFTRLPYPSVVAGDTLRDSLGVAAPLRAVAFNSAGGEVADAAIQYIALDTGLTITEHDLVIAQRRSGSVPIVASATTVQTPRVSLFVTRRPDSVAIVGAARDTIDYELLAPDSPNHTSAELRVKVMTADSTGGITTTQGWLVSYQTTFRGGIIPPGDASTVFLLGDGVQRSTIDTTDASGSAFRRLRLNLAGSGLATTADSAFITATVRYKGAEVRGSPLRFVILLRPKPAP